MPAAAAGPQLNRTEVIERLVAEAPPAVVTPNRRLARALERDVSFARLASGLRTWRSPDILPVTAFVERAYAALLYSERGAALPLLLTQAQEQALWESAIRDSGAVLIAVPDAAALAREAWQLAHAWGIAARIQGFPGNDDVRAFADWALRYQRKTADAGQIDTARLTDLLARYWGCDEIGRPGELIAYGFDAITPQQSALLSALAAAGCKVARAGAEPLPAHAVRIECADRRDEIARAAAWARARLEARPDARIGVVVPELARQRAALLRAFSAAMRPDYALPGQAPRVMPFNVSLGEPLNACPLVNAALGVLELASREIAFERASRLLRSPFIAGAEAERLGRARADAALRRRAEPSVTLDRLLALLAREGSACPLLLQRLSALAELRRQRLFGAQRPSALAQAMHEALARAGFPGERSLDSAEFQALQKWHELLAAFAALDRVLGRTSYAEALARLRRMAADTLFQPETPEVPVQILGVLEAAGMRFDHLWVMGLSDQSWPPAPRPNPFLPIELQRAARITHSTAAESLLWAQRQTEAWLAAAHEVVLSHPQRDQDRELQASALIGAIGAIGAIVARPAQSSGAPGPPAPDPVGYREQVHGSSRMESLADSAAPPVALPAVLRGGTAVLSDQAACPFRATARHRLGANALEAPHSGLDARERGTLVHRVLARTWTELGSKAAL
ncbi:MAG TPA: hypothetical protein VMK05_00625, partial [Burkholderiales bacterium]|nr:hypothetical protein [Burkholderiales bacterium]